MPVNQALNVGQEAIQQFAEFVARELGNVIRCQAGCVAVECQSKIQIVQILLDKPACSVWCFHLIAFLTAMVDIAR